MVIHRRKDVWIASRIRRITQNESHKTSGKKQTNKRLEEAFISLVSCHCDFFTAKWAEKQPEISPKVGQTDEKSQNNPQKQRKWGQGVGYPPDPLPAKQPKISPKPAKNTQKEAKIGRK